MQSRCRNFRASAALTGLSVLTALSLLLPSVTLAAPLDNGEIDITDESASTFVAQRPEGGSSGEAGSGMSDRIRKYMGEGEGSAQGSGGGQGSRGERGGGDMQDRRERMRQKFMEMSPEQREQFKQKIRQRRGGGGGGGGHFQGMDGPPGGGPDGPPPFPPGGDFPGDGGPPGGFRDGGPDGGPPFGPPGGGRFDGKGQGGSHRGVRSFGSSSKGGGGGGGKPFFGRAPLDLTVLNLTQDQKTQIQAMRTKNGQKVKAIHSSLKDRRDKFKDMLFDPTASNEQILAARKEISKLQTQAEDVMLNDFLSIRKLLTKEQMALLPQVRPEERRPSRPMTRGGGRASGPPSEISDRPPNFD